MKRKTTLSLWLIALLMAVGLTSCQSDPEPDAPHTATPRTLLVYMPWTGASNSLLSAFRQNIADIKTAIEANGLEGDRVLVLLAETASEARLFELTDNAGTCEESSLKTYSRPAYNTAAGIAAILSDVRSLAPAESYAMLIGSHGMGWVHASAYNATSSTMASLAPRPNRPSLTRFFGSSSEADFQTDIETLAAAIQTASVPMEFILFDDCYMANAETAYALRNVTHYLVASTSEVMNYGLPYADVFPYLLGTPQYGQVCQGMVDFYHTYTIGGKAYPYATLSVTDCTQMDALASIMSRVNAAHPYDAAAMDITQVQQLDGYRESGGTLFYDLGDYVQTLCADDAELWTEFSIQLQRTVPYAAHTDRIFCNQLSWTAGEDGTIKLNAYSGLTVSDPSENIYAKDKKTTAWWQMTH